MTLKDDLEAEVDRLFRSPWASRDGRVVPADTDVGLGNDAVRLEDAVVLYADMADSTKLVDEHPWEFAAEIYKAFLYCAAKIIKDEGGEITAYDGDRIMSVFIGGSKNTSAARAALKLNFCRIKIIAPLLQKRYPSKTYELKHVVGIDRSELHAAKTGVRGANDLVWVGRAANYAAKLTTLPDDYPTWITEDVYNSLADSLKTTNGQSMWEARSWTAMNNKRIYCSTWWWRVD